MEQRIGVVADTHRKPGKPLPQALLLGLRGVDRIVHAGDWVCLEVAEQLETIAPLDGVAGNNDGEEIVRRFGRRKLLKIGDFTLGLVHGDGRKSTTERRAFDAFRDERPDLIIFGHSHIPFDGNRDGVRLFNPGSPTDKRRQPLYSFGILHLMKDGWRIEHIFFSGEGSHGVSGNPPDGGRNPD